MNGPTAVVSTAVVIAKNLAKDQRLVNRIPLGVILTGYPLNNYDRTKGLIHTLGDACRQQGRALLQKLLVFVHDQLSGGATPDHVFARLFAKQRDMVPA
jgi:hypothetical protein